MKISESKQALQMIFQFNIQHKGSSKNIRSTIVSRYDSNSSHQQREFRLFSSANQLGVALFFSPVYIQCLRGRNFEMIYRRTPSGPWKSSIKHEHRKALKCVDLERQHIPVPFPVYGSINFPPLIIEEINLAILSRFSMVTLWQEKRINHVWDLHFYVGSIH